MAKASAKSTTSTRAESRSTAAEATKYVYVTRGYYAGQFMQLPASQADVATGDQWGKSCEAGYGPEGYDTSIPEGWSTSPYDLPQSLVDFQNSAIPESPPDGGNGPEPEPAPAPTLDTLEPNTAELGSADVTMSARGSDFTEETRIVFAGNQENTVFVSDTEVTTIIKPSLGWGVVSVPVYVRTGEQQSDPLDFSFTAAPEEDE